MFDQEKTGKYIAEKRKKMGMTQKQLAEQVGITDKAVSKWERGKSIPDSMVMEELCRTLQININEFFSGEDILDEHYSGRAEENMRELIKESDVQRKRSKTVILCLAIGFLFVTVAVFVGLYATSMYGSGLNDMTRFVDVPSQLFLVGIVSGLLGLSGAAADFARAFPLCFGKAETDPGQAKRSAGAVKTVMVLNLLAGAFLFLGQLIPILSKVGDAEELLRTVSVLLLTVWYGVALDLLLMPVLYRLKRE